MLKKGRTYPALLGRSRAEGGFSIIELVFVTGLISIIVAIAIPMYVSFIQKARETSIISYLDKARRAQEIYVLENPAGLFSGSFDELETTGYITPSTGAASRVEEAYQLTLSSGIVSGLPVWSITASPVAANPNARHFYIDQTGVMRFAVGAAAGPSSPQVQQ